MSKLHKTLIRRPAETRTAALGSAAAAVEAFTAPWWTAALTFVVSWAPAVFTWVVASGGVRGVWREIAGSRHG